MIVLLWKRRNHVIGESYHATLHPEVELIPVLVRAEAMFKGGGVSEVSVYHATVCKARWGPEDPGGIFNSGGVPTYDKGERENNELESRVAEVHGEAGRAEQVPGCYPAPGAVG